MPSGVLYHCPCLDPSPTPRPAHLASSSHSFHPLPTLFFCEECDAVRCNRCVSVEISGYYCPNCLFEVPGASVRAEKNRCARNCFLCPCCRNTLSVVSSDPPDSGDPRLSVIPANVVGEPPFVLYCNHCRWDSLEAGIKFDKPTGLAAQLQKDEDDALDTLEFEALKHHFEPIFRAAAVAAQSSHGPSSAVAAAAHLTHVHKSPVTAAASAALARDVPGVAKYNPVRSTRSSGGGAAGGFGSVGAGRDRGIGANEGEVPTYKARLKCADGKGAWGGDRDVEWMRQIENIEEVATVEQRWSSGLSMSLRTDDLRPLRVPLHAKVSKRCPSCTHILIKPEQKAQSVRYKIKLVAANYLPAITVAMPHAQPPQPSLKRTGTAGGKPAPEEERREGGSDGGGARLIAGKSYAFHLALTNPLYDPIQVRLERVYIGDGAATAAAGADGSSGGGVGTGTGERARRPPFAVALPTAPFSIASFAEAWEYDEDEDMFGVVEDDDLGVRKGAKEDAKKMKTVGVLEKRVNVTVVGGEVVIRKGATGSVKFHMRVSYTYRSDDPAPSGEGREGITTPSKGTSKPPEVKTFSFFTLVELGEIMPKEEAKAEMDARP